MTQISKIYALMGGNGEALYSSIRNNERNKDRDVLRGLKQFNPKLHDVASREKRPDKIVFVPTGKKDENKKDIYTAKTEAPARVPISVQKYIINQKGSFARGSGVALKPSEEGTETFPHVLRNWEDNKTNFYLKETFVKMKSETQCAVIFYGTPGAARFEDFRFRMKIVSPSKGDVLEPLFDENEDLVAFGREYRIKEDGEEVTRYDAYVMNPETGRCEIWRYQDGELMLRPALLNDEDQLPRQEPDIIQTPYTSLPVVYWEQDDPECDDTEEMIKEFEFAFSDFLTQMGYSADPILFGKGKTLDLPAKGSAGKFVEGSPDSDLKFVTPDNATESRDLQFSMLQKFIFSLNRAVLLDLDTMKELGDISGAALERYLLDAYMEATDNQMGSWGLGVQRMVNWLLSQWKNLTRQDDQLRVTAVFSRFDVRSEMEKVLLAKEANGGKPVVDHEFSIGMADLANDPVATLEKIKQERLEAVTHVPVPGADPAPVTTDSGTE